MDSAGSRIGALDEDKRYEHLENITQQFAHWNDLYVMSPIATAASAGRVRLKSDAARRHLERVHQLYARDQFGAFADLKSIRSIEELSTELFARGKLILAGDPGIGKTTTLERLALELATEALANMGEGIPVLHHLAEFRQTGFDVCARRISEQRAEYVRTGERIVVLLDGLNEVPEALQSEVIEYIAESPDLIMVACRVQDLPYSTSGLDRVEIQPFSVDDIQQLLGSYFENDDADHLFWQMAASETESVWRWYVKRASAASFDDFWHGDIVPTRSVEVEAQALNRLREQAAQGEFPALLGLARNPLLLFQIIFLYQTTGSLPNKRVSLFNDLVGVLARRSGSNELPSSDADEQNMRAVLELLAYEMQRTRLGTFVSENVARQLVHSRTATLDVEAGLRLATEIKIIDRRARSQLTFHHHLLQEYFAACQLATEYESMSSLSLFGEDWWLPSQWDETVMFLFQLLGDASAGVRWLARANPTLAYRALAQPGVTCLTADLTRLLLNPEDASRVCPIARASWGRSLCDSPEGDTRPGVGLDDARAPSFSWVFVPPGVFNFGGDASLSDLHDHPPATRIENTDGFYVAKYPVTVAQFEQFVLCGYGQEQYWTSAGWNWKGMQESPIGWENLFERGAANEPVTGISWYEAIAFCNWCNDMCKKSPVLPGRNLIRLPTESEWERVARYPNSRTYPWGSSYRPGDANIDEAADDATLGPYFLRRKSAVGLYEKGRSELSVYDLAGNVWEWTLTAYNEEYVYPEDNSVDSTAPFRVIRGGSWSNSGRFARSAYRDHTDVDFCFNDVGFRVIFGHSNTNQTG